MFAVGLFDDLWTVPPAAKLLVQVLAVVLLLYAGHAFWQGEPAWVSLPLTFLWVIGVINAINLIDGIDGLAAGITAVAAGALVLISLALGQIGLASVAAALVGASLGLLIYNAPPARIFMGDCGSLLLGYLLAVGTLGIQGSGALSLAHSCPLPCWRCPSSTQRSPLSPACCAGVPSQREETIISTTGLFRSDFQSEGL